MAHGIMHWLKRIPKGYPPPPPKRKFKCNINFHCWCIHVHMYYILHTCTTNNFRYNYESSLFAKEKWSFLFISFCPRSPFLLTFDFQVGSFFFSAERVLRSDAVLSLVIHLDAADLELVLLAHVLLHVLVALGQDTIILEPATPTAKSPLLFMHAEYHSVSVLLLLLAKSPLVFMCTEYHCFSFVLLAKITFTVHACRISLSFSFVVVVSKITFSFHVHRISLFQFCCC